MILGMLCEGSSIRTIQRLVGVEQRTILRMLVDLVSGMRADAGREDPRPTGQGRTGRRAVELVRCKQGTKERKKIDNPDAGDAYCYFGIERTSKLVLAWHLGRRNAWDCHDFIEKLATATAGRFQLSTDGFNAYPNAVEYALGGRVDYAQVVKEFASAGGEEARRYAPPRLIGQEKITVSGTPDEDRVSTSHVERANWTLRGPPPAVHPSIERLQPEEGEPSRRAGALLRLLQFLPDA